MGCILLCRFYWGCDPISYAQRALAINEFSAPRWQNLKTPSGESVGNTVLDQRGIPHEQWWIWCASICDDPLAQTQMAAGFSFPSKLVCCFIHEGQALNPGEDVHRRHLLFPDCSLKCAMQVGGRCDCVRLGLVQHRSVAVPCLPGP